MFLIQYLYENQIGYIQLFDDSKDHDAFEEIRRTITRNKQNRKVNIHKLTRVEYCKFENNTDARMYYAWLLGQKMGERPTITLPEIKWVRLGPNLLKWVAAAEEKDRLQEEAFERLKTVKNWKDAQDFHSKMTRYKNFNAKKHK